VEPKVDAVQTESKKRPLPDASNIEESPAQNQKRLRK
jgi:hypothetical protein